jgi:hypothetical protein
VSEQEQVDYAAEVMLDFMTSAADGKDDDEFVFIESAVHALAEACGVDFTEEMEPLTAGEIRQRARRGRRRLAVGDGP